MTNPCSTSPARSRPTASKDCSGSRSPPTVERSTSRSPTAIRISSSTRSRSTATRPTPRSGGHCSSSPTSRRITTAAASSSAPTGSCTGRWVTAAAPAIPAGRARTRRTCSATSSASTPPTPARTAGPTPSPPTTPSPTASTVRPRSGSTDCATRGGCRSTAPRSDLWIADVGQSAIEEVDFLPAGTPAGQNFGWSDVEGTHPYRQGRNPPPGPSLPIYEYDHSGGRCSITGGYVYRGNDIPTLQGTYLFADYCDGKINGLVRQGRRPDLVTDLRLAAGGLIVLRRGR